jgi:hypothetical protein
MTRKEEIEQEAVKWDKNHDNAFFWGFKAGAYWADLNPPKRCGYCGTVDGHGAGCSIATALKPDEEKK